MTEIIKSVPDTDRIRHMILKYTKTACRHKRYACIYIDSNRENSFSFSVLILTFLDGDTIKSLLQQN